MPRSVRCSLLLVVLAIAGCVAPAAPIRPDLPPRQPKADRSWAHAVDLLRVGDDAEARVYVEQAVELGGDSNPLVQMLLLRDLAELRLATADGPGAALAAREAEAMLARAPRSATLSEDERRLNQHLLDALEAAGQGDLRSLERLAQTTTDAGRAADPWYLLGWTREQRGDTSAAREAYRSYLERVPEFGILRRSALMREHARSVLDGR